MPISEKFISDLRANLSEIIHKVAITSREDHNLKVAILQSISQNQQPPGHLSETFQNLFNQLKFYYSEQVFEELYPFETEEDKLEFKSVVKDIIEELFAQYMSYSDEQISESLEDNSTESDEDLKRKRAHSFEIMEKVRKHQKPSVIPELTEVENFVLEEIKNSDQMTPEIQNAFRQLSLQSQSKVIESMVYAIVEPYFLRDIMNSKFLPPYYLQILRIYGKEKLQGIIKTPEHFSILLSIFPAGACREFLEIFDAKFLDNLLNTGEILFKIFVEIGRELSESLIEFMTAEKILRLMGGIENLKNIFSGRFPDDLEKLLNSMGVGFIRIVENLNHIVEITRPLDNPRKMVFARFLTKYLPEFVKNKKDFSTFITPFNAGIKQIIIDDTKSDFLKKIINDHEDLISVVSLFSPSGKPEFLSKLGELFIAKLIIFYFVKTFFGSTIGSIGELTQFFQSESRDRPGFFSCQPNTRLYPRLRGLFLALNQCSDKQVSISFDHDNRFTIQSGKHSVYFHLSRDFSVCLQSIGIKHTSERRTPSMLQMI